MSLLTWQTTALLAVMAIGGMASACASADSAGPGGVAGAVASKKTPEACKPSTAKAKKVHAGLAGESRQCKALGIAACNLRFSGAYGEDVYTCFTAGGASAVAVPVSEIATGLPCSQAQLDAWVAAYATPCWRWVAASALPASAITLLLDTERLPKHVCSNVDGTIFRFTAACAEHTYEVARTTGGGNFHGTSWSLDIAPPTTAALRDGFPFLACGSFDAYNDSGCDWHVGVTQDAAHLGIFADDVTHPCGGPVVWADVLAEVTAAFAGCGVVDSL